MCSQHDHSRISRNARIGVAHAPRPLWPGYLRSATDRLAFEATPSEPARRVAVASEPLNPPMSPRSSPSLRQTRRTGAREP